MSNQYYKYISKLIVNYFVKSEIKPGDRFYLQLDSQEEVNNLVEAFEKHENCQPFSYQHSLGEAYQTISIELDNLKLVVANTSAEVKPDFLVTLRNQVVEQQNEWQNAVLLSVVSEQLDSIQGGSSDLQKEGMPLHPTLIFKSIKKEIESTLSKNDQIILMDILNHMLDDHYLQQVTILDFEEIYNIMSKGSLADEDYNKFGLFKDESLSTFTGNKLKDRLGKNRELYDFIKKAHDFGSIDDDLEKKFLPKDIVDLKKDDWVELSFSTVNQYAESKKSTDKKTKIDLLEIKNSNKAMMWEKPNSETSAGKRKIHLVIFNENIDSVVNLQLKFEITGSEEKSISKAYFTFSKGEAVETQIGRSNVGISIPGYDDRPTFLKVTYKHEQKNSLKYEFNIAVIPCSEMMISEFKTGYLVDTKKKAIVLESDAEKFSIGSGFNNEDVDFTEYGVDIQVPEDTTVSLLPQAEGFDEDDHLLVNIHYRHLKLPILLKNDLPESTPIHGAKIWRMKRELEQDFQLDHNRITIGSRTFYMLPDYKQYFEWERNWVDRGWYSAFLESGQLKEQTVELAEDLREAYSRFIQYFRIKRNIPSLSYMSEQLIDRATEYVNEYIKEINQFEEGKAPGNKGRSLMNLGMVKSQNVVYLTPFHPLVVAYQLILSEKVGTEKLDTSILNRLKMDGLIPYIYNGRDILFKPDSQSAAPEWIVFKPVREVTVSDANQYLARVVQDKINQFEEHFSYLFMAQSKAPIQLNVINITNDKEVLIGIIKWMIDRIEKKGPDSLKPFEVSLYFQKNTSSSFDHYSKLSTVEEVENYLGFTFKSKQYDKNDLLRFIRNHLAYFKHEESSEKKYRYSHISFYKMEAEEKDALQPMEDMKTGISLDGITSTVASMKGEENYRSGFGIKGAQMDQNILLKATYVLNELAANMRNDGNDTYRKGESIVSRTNTENEETLENIFSTSCWVTFIDPNVDLEFFHAYDRNLVVIHYSDQYTSSSRYDAITVTDRSHQFNSSIRDFLKVKNIEASTEQINASIKAFNTFNGEWLLRIIGGKGYFAKEKLSIISAIKYSLSYFNHQNIIWVPISLEEILRVAGAVGLNKRDGVFTAKNLGVTGKHSDDLLLIGLENEDERLKMHFYPIEVKIGINGTSVIEKARKQLSNTRKLLDQELADHNERMPFSNLFYRNFFVQLFIANARKIHDSKLWPQKNYVLSEETIEKLLQNDYEVSSDLKDYIGNGAIISFEKDAFHRSSHLDEKIMSINLTEDDGINGIIEEIQLLTDKIEAGKTDFIKEKLLTYSYKQGNMSISYNDPDNDPQSVYLTKNELRNAIADGDRAYHSSNFYLESSRIKLGKITNSNKEIYWEYGNKGLANRHLLISGKSGQGKTYFMQCLLLEKSMQGISSIVIDYTEGFLSNQLEDEFTGELGDKFRETIVYNEKFPINPFKRNERTIGSLTILENETDVAEKIRSVFGSVYDKLGIQQLNAIYEATINGLQRFGDNMDLKRLKLMLEEDNSSYAKTALSQIRPLIDRNPFREGSELNWQEIMDRKGEVYVIQLTGYPRDVQLMITEFILWDLWNFSVRNGNKDKPMPVIMDEAQNLDHTENSPSARILQEGRKFGWSAWYATQFLKSQLDTDELARLQNASQKVYFAPPEQEVSNIASSLAQSPVEKKEWENKLSALKKGQCIVHGPVLNDDGTLSKPVVSIVDITPLSERIRHFEMSQ